MAPAAPPRSGPGASTSGDWQPTSAPTWASRATKRASRSERIRHEPHETSPDPVAEGMHPRGVVERSRQRVEHRAADLDLVAVEPIAEAGVDEGVGGQIEHLRLATARGDDLLAPRLRRLVVKRDFAGDAQLR